MPVSANADSDWVCYIEKQHTLSSHSESIKFQGSELWSYLKSANNFIAVAKVSQISSLQRNMHLASEAQLSSSVLALRAGFQFFTPQCQFGPSQLLPVTSPFLSCYPPSSALPDKQVSKQGTLKVARLGVDLLWWRQLTVIHSSKKSWG